jgi:hypothetical protein
MDVRLRTAIVVLGALALAPAALARPVTPLERSTAPAPVHSSDSTNWAGYAVHRPGTSFRQIGAVWTEPAAACRPGHRAFSSYWIGLGGYSTSSPALEQAGTEVDCTAAGHVQSFAWYEVVPAGSVRVRLKVPPGDLIQGTVAVTGRRVRFVLQDLTRQTKFSKVLQARVADVSSAEWIVEAPSQCIGHGRCYTLPLANFGLAAFDDALVQPVAGRSGSIADARWRRTQIRLIPHDRSFVRSHPGLGSGGRAFPSGLETVGSAFTVASAPLAPRSGGAGAAAPRPRGALARRTIWAPLDGDLGGLAHTVLRH